jgi:parvulin-like peptidyl-prolyl isomerase
MGVVIKLAGQEINEEELFPLLAQYKMLPQLTKEIVVDRAIANIKCDSEEEEMVYQRYYQQNQITSEEQFKQWSEYYGMLPEQLKCSLLRDYKLEKYKQATWGSRVEPYFLQNRKQFDLVVYYLIRSKDAEVAQELYFRIQEGETSFNQLANRYSQDVEADMGGLVGPIELRNINPTFAQMLGTSKLGKLNPPTRIGDWWIIFRVEKYLSAKLDEAMQQRIIDSLFQKWLNAELQKKSTTSARGGEIENRKTMEKG